eukprot:m.57439 g.57439  ORF g.57439 m.57439 type:complete len:180 (+) comp15802_c0_seq3:1100-1639(+)
MRAREQIPRACCLELPLTCNRADFTERIFVFPARKTRNETHTPSSMSSLYRAFKAVVDAGGPTAAFWSLVQKGAILPGRLVGQDKFGNKYYESDEKFFSRNRNVAYADFWNFDGSQVPPEWHKWLHYMTDELPSKDHTTHKWQTDHTPNLSGTVNAYVPYSTTRPKISAWTPPPPKPKQ